MCICLSAVLVGCIACLVGQTASDKLPKFAKVPPVPVPENGDALTSLTVLGSKTGHTPLVARMVIVVSVLRKGEKHFHRKRQRQEPMKKLSGGFEDHHKRNADSCIGWATLRLAPTNVERRAAVANCFYSVPPAATTTSN
eukprot:GHVT01084171.1.p1 GENE.GHVT01084171.1~~GHVT01084171.1.p1  ORF type:complete len:140 (-),score=14.74 GHVT01084171.1:947-1366(-)